MTKEQWKKLRNFRPTERDLFGRRLDKYENGGMNDAGIDVQPISWELMRRLDEMVSYAKDKYGDDSYCIIHDINGGKHSHPHSQHYKGRAVDYHIKNLYIDEMFFMAAFFGFRGIYYYPVKEGQPWIHADVRLDKRVWGFRTFQGKYVTTNSVFREVIEI